MTHTVLIVDDSLTVRMDLADAFTAAGFRPVPCATAAEARATLSDGNVDAIVLDVLLPDANGVDLLHEIRATPGGSTVSVVMLSSEVEIADRIRGLRTGADEYVGKPYDADYLVAKVEKLVRASRAFPSAPSIAADVDTHVTTILVIDDSATYRDAMRQALTAADYGVIDAISGEEGLRLAATRRPDAILVDGVLPGIDGASVIRHLRLDAALRDVPCLLLTASEGTDAELRALDAGADAFVHKEENLDVILARLAAMLRRSPTRPIAGADAKTLLGLKKILAVDDSLTYLYTLGDALKTEGYDIILAHSGEEALALLAVQEVDCILLDMQMPGLSGQETCERIKAAPAVRDIPLIMLTALDQREAMIQGLAAGADDYISKSSELEVLKARVRAQIRRKQFEDENRRIREELLRQQHEASEARAARELAETKAVLVDELERKNKELEAFSYSVSHDLRAPLRAINGFSQVLLEDYAPTLAPEATESLQRITAAAQRMSALIDDLLNLSRVALAELKRSRVDLSAIARGVIDRLRGGSDREVEIVVASELIVDADRRLMEVALENLLGNSWKFTAKVAHPRIEVGCASGSIDLGSVDPAGGETTYFVRDNGAGFDMSSVERLFKPFRRLHAESEFPGTGIGLATVARIFERHGGRVWADGAVGRGATFYFTVPPDRYGGLR